MLAHFIRRYGPDHPSTQNARHNLAHWRGEAGDAPGAATALEQLLADQLRVLGPDHPSTLNTRHQLAYWRSQASLQKGRGVSESLDNGTVDAAPETPRTDRPETHPETEG
jgi:hypothetical protein